MKIWVACVTVHDVFATLVIEAEDSDSALMVVATELAAKGILMCVEHTFLTLTSDDPADYFEIVPKSMQGKLPKVNSMGARESN